MNFACYLASLNRSNQMAELCRTATFWAGGSGGKRRPFSSIAERINA